MNHPSTSPIYKIGAVLLQGDRVMLVRPLPKTPGEVPPLVLPRGSRQYRDAQGVWQDARDATTAAAHAEALEPLERGLLREAEEEAGLPAAHAERLRPEALGAMDFTSRSKGVYPIYWFVLRLDAAALQALTDPTDASERDWVTLDEARRLAASGAMSAGYLPVIEKVLLP